MSEHLLRKRDDTIEEVLGRPYMRGLFVLTRRDRETGDDYLIIVHSHSGTYLLELEPELLPEVTPILLPLDWSVPGEEVYVSKQHRAAVEEAMSKGNRNRRFSSIREEAIARELGARLTINSGATAHDPRDMVLPPIEAMPGVLLELKNTLPDSQKPDRYRLICDDLEHLYREARIKGLLPLFVIEFRGEPSQALSIMPLDIIEEFITAPPFSLTMKGDLGGPKKAYVIDRRSLYQELGEDVAYTLVTKKRRWAIIPYLVFLQLRMGGYLR